MEEKRRLTRHALSESFMLVERDTGEYLGTIEDINTGGIRLSSHQNLDKKDTYYCRMNLPYKILGKDFINMDVTNVWLKKHDSQSLGGFLMMTSWQGLAMIEMIINQYSGKRM